MSGNTVSTVILYTVWDLNTKYWSYTSRLDTSTSRAEWDGYSDGLPLSPRYESRLEGVSFT